MSVQTIRDRIVVKREESSERTKSGLYVAHVEEKNVKGTVLAIGSGRVTIQGGIIPLDVKVGDTILFNKNNAVEVKDGEDTLHVLREDDVICIVR